MRMRIQTRGWVREQVHDPARWCGRPGRRPSAQRRKRGPFPADRVRPPPDPAGGRLYQTPLRPPCSAVLACELHDLVDVVLGDEPRSRADVLRTIDGLQTVGRE